MTDLSDEHLMQRVQAGKLNYMELLFNRYQKRLYNYFLKCTLDADESADLAQITFIRVMKYRASYNPRRGFEVWLFQIARNLVKDHFRKLKVHRDQYDLVESLPEHAEDDEARQQLEREHLLNQAMAKLPPEKRELLVMAKFQGMKYEQIAEITETSVGNVKVQVHRAIAQLRDLYFDIEHKEQ
ncbi:MAG: sigma-70 family RNA polymerase sigma factor [Bacteroidota bacterium]